jgi:hypothetical protein
MGKKQQIVTWVLMMLTAVRQRFGYSRLDFVSVAETYQLIPFLIEHYELLHYYDNDYVADSVIHYAAEQGGDLRVAS